MTRDELADACKDIVAYAAERSERSPRIATDLLLSAAAASLVSLAHAQEDRAVSARVLGNGVIGFMSRLEKMVPWLYDDPGAKVH